MPIYAPDAEPLDFTVKLRLSRRQMLQLDRLCDEFGMSRAWLIREAMADGLPAAVERLRRLFAEGYRPAGMVRRHGRDVRLRGPRLDGPHTDRFVHEPKLRPPRPRPRPADEDVI